MSTDLTAVIVAVVGVAGTLTSPLLAQRVAVRTRELEIKARHQRHREERSEKRHIATFKERQAISIALNITARAFRQALKNCAYEPTEQRHAEVENARKEFTAKYGEMQVILPEEVLASAAEVGGCLATAYGRLMELRAHSVTYPGPVSVRDQLEAYLDGDVHEAIRELRRVIRAELGQSGPELPGSTETAS